MERPDDIKPPTVLRETEGTCPVCVERVPARVVEDGGDVYLEKTCPTHGTLRSLLSRRADGFRELLECYFDLVPGDLPQRDYILRLTGRCNMSCPICLADADEFAEDEPSIDRIEAFLAGRTRLKLDLMGAEPTLRDDLEAIIRMAAARGHITALHTNGLRIADPEYLGRLVRAGLREVHLQFDGFDESADRVLRGRSMAGAHEAAVASIARYGLATDLVVTVLRGVNEPEMSRVLDYAAGLPFVKEVFFLGCRRLGRARDAFGESALAPDELIDPLEAQTGGRIRRHDVHVFQKLYFALLAVFRVRKCFYIQHYLVLRDLNGYRPVSEFVDLGYLEPRLDRFRRLYRRSRLLSVPYLFVHTGIAVLRRRGFALIVHGLLLQFLLWLGFDLSRVTGRVILLGFITACDPWNYDRDVALRCGKGEVSCDQGERESGADANVARERDHRRASSDRG
jgi:MoaA/NifB/PqqE/SkfB family radical SAM enzyme